VLESDYRTNNGVRLAICCRNKAKLEKAAEKIDGGELF
jgi:hypothetical protein